MFKFTYSWQNNGGKLKFKKIERMIFMKRLMSIMASICVAIGSLGIIPNIGAYADTGEEIEIDGLTYCFHYDIEGNCVLDKILDYTYYDFIDKLLIPDKFDKIGGGSKILLNDDEERLLNVKNIIIPDYAIEIGENAFEDCEDLESIQISSKVATIGSHAFNNCKCLKSVKFLGNISSIGLNAFGMCPIEELEIPINMIEVFKTSGSSVKYDLKKLTLTGKGEVPANAFEDFKKLISVCIKDGVTQICENAFKNCVNIKSVSLPSTLSGIYSPEDFKNAKTIEFPYDYELNHLGLSSAEQLFNYFPNTKIIFRDENGKSYEVRDDGTTCVNISKSQKVNWLREYSDNSSAWYGIEDPNGILKEGSSFHVQWFQSGNVPKNEEERYKEIYDRLDDKFKVYANGGKLWIFDMGVTRPDGTEYGELNGTVYVYVELGEDWSSDNLDVVYLVYNGEDTRMTFNVVLDNNGQIGVPDPGKYYARIVITHFSPYAILDTETQVPKTGDIVSFIPLMQLSVIAFVLMKSSREEIFF